MARRAHTATFPVKLPVERTWEVMADTQHLNQIFFGLSALQVVARDGEKARLRGSFGLFAPEYDEYPWAFEVPRHYKSVRVFVRGLVKRLEVECRLREGEQAAHTLVDYRLDVETVAGIAGALAALVVVRRLRSGLERARAFLEKLDAGTRPQWPPQNPQREAVALRARAALERVELADADERAALERILAHVADAPEPDVARMRPYELADAWGTARQKTLSACLRATRAGLLRLSWDLLCPSCEAPSSFSTLKDLPHGGHCPACDIDFSTNIEQNVEATFAPEPAVRKSERLVFCHGSPASTRSWLAQFVVEPKQKHALTLRLGLGRYRVQAAGVGRAALLDVVDRVESGAAGPVAVAVERGAEQGGGPAFAPATLSPAPAGEVTLVVENRDDKARRVQLAHRAFASKAATAADVTALGLYRELFGGEALAADQHLQVGRATILFTDLVGSTAMYERIGDAAAYALVREHFRLLFAEIEKHDGRVVKTVGDCVMASFDAPVEAARAGRGCVLALRALSKEKNAGLALKVGVHTGACLAVSANGQIDYFGRTVNVAARVEGLAGPDELVLSWTTAADAEVRAFVDEAKHAGDDVRDDKKPIKGVAGEVDVVRVAVAGRAP